VFWCLVGLVAINVSWFIFGYRGNVGGAQFHVYFSRAVVFLNRVWIATMACRFILEARRSGALELMLTSPLPVRTLMRGHWRALRHLFFWQVFFIALLHVFYVVGSLKPAAPGMMVPPNALQSYALAAAGSMVSFLADVFGLCWLGAWISLASRKPNLAVLKTFTLVILIPEAIAYFLPAYRVAFGGGLLSYYVARPACWILKNSLFVAFAAYKLRRHFRAAAAGAYAWNWWRPHWPWRAERTRRPALKGPGFERAVAPPTLRDGGGCR
jgi:hypothetical protein